jgi:hypothetical protein
MEGLIATLLLELSRRISSVLLNTHTHTHTHIHTRTHTGKGDPPHLGGFTKNDTDGQRFDTHTHTHKYKYKHTHTHTHSLTH